MKTSSDEEESLTAIVSPDRVGKDGRWICSHKIYGLSCQNLRCRFEARMLETLNRRQRQATEKRQKKGLQFLPACYLDPRQFTDEEKLVLFRDLQQIKEAFQAVGMESARPPS